jgi:transketolase
MQILAPCDPLECIDATKYCATQKIGPAYLRIGKAGEPVLTSDALEPFIFGKIRYLKGGSQICITSYGPIIKLGFEFSDYLETLGISCSIISCHTLKPLDISGLKEVLKKYQKIFTIEEHIPQGGLTSQLKQLAWDIDAKAEIYSFTLKNEFIHNYGTHEELLDSHGISLKKIIDTFSREK